MYKKQENLASTKDHLLVRCDFARGGGFGARREKRRRVKIVEYWRRIGRDLGQGLGYGIASDSASPAKASVVDWSAGRQGYSFARRRVKRKLFSEDVEA